MTTEEQEKQPELGWQQLTPQDAFIATKAGYSHHMANPTAIFGLTSLSPEILKAINTGYLSQEEILGNTPLTTEETIRQTAIAIVGRVRNNMRQKLGLFEETAEPENEWLGLLDKAVSEETNPEEKARLNRALKRIRLVWNNLQRLTDPANAISLDVEPGDEHNPPMLNFSKPR